MTDIQQAVARAFGVPPESLLGPARTGRVAMARHCAFWLARSMPERPSFPEIARAFNRKHHTTVMSGCAKIDRLVRHSAIIRSKLADAREIIAKGEVGAAIQCGGFIAGYDDKGRAYDLLDFERDDFDRCVVCHAIRGRHVVEDAVAA